MLGHRLRHGVGALARHGLEPLGHRQVEAGPLGPCQRGVSRIAQEGMPIGEGLARDRVGQRAGHEGASVQGVEAVARRDTERLERIDRDASAGDGPMAGHGARVGREVIELRGVDGLDCRWQRHRLGRRGERPARLAVRPGRRRWPRSG